MTELYLLAIPIDRVRSIEPRLHRAVDAPQQEHEEPEVTEPRIQERVPDARLESAPPLTPR